MSSCPKEGHFRRASAEVLEAVISSRAWPEGTYWDPNPRDLASTEKGSCTYSPLGYGIAGRANTQGWAA